MESHLISSKKSSTHSSLDENSAVWYSVGARDLRYEGEEASRCQPHSPSFAQRPRLTPLRDAHGLQRPHARIG